MGRRISEIAMIAGALVVMACMSMFIDMSTADLTYIGEYNVIEKAIVTQKIENSEIQQYTFRVWFKDSEGITREADIYYEEDFINMERGNKIVVYVLKGKFFDYGYRAKPYEP